MNLFVKAFVVTLGILSAFISVVITLNYFLVLEDRRLTNQMIKARKAQFKKENYNTGYKAEFINGKYTGNVVKDEL